MTASLPATYKRWILNEYTTGPLNDNTFKLEEVPFPELQDGQIACRVSTIGYEPSMRPSYSLEKSYRGPQPLHKPLWAFGIGEVVASKSDKHKVGA